MHVRAACNPPATSSRIMADESGQGLLSREVPSVALDWLFLELHEQLPADARGKFAQLAVEVKRLSRAPRRAR